MKIYEDSRGWQYSVRPGLGGDSFSVFYRKPAKSWHSVRAVAWYKTKAEADKALDDYAARHKMRRADDEKD